ncbi:hypothetical protein GCM10010421_20730 [Streptomyces glaucus]|uniref:Uncharacterized protein n=1 Tax=Streptomyces glaucus TaxID=284029 RepID=A0ABP5WRQ9_9ACTN
MNAESQDHWCGYRFREGTVDVPVQLSSSTRTARARSEGAGADGSYATPGRPVSSPGPGGAGGEAVRTRADRPVGRVAERVVRSTRGSPRTSGRSVRPGLP